MIRRALYCNAQWRERVSFRAAKPQRVNQTPRCLQHAIQIKYKLVRVLFSTTCCFYPVKLEANNGLKLGKQEMFVAAFLPVSLGAKGYERKENLKLMRQNETTRKKLLARACSQGTFQASRPCHSECGHLRRHPVVTHRRTHPA